MPGTDPDISASGPEATARPGRPISAADPSSLQVLLDFDGTLVEPNVAIVLVEKFCDGGIEVAREVDELLHAGKMTLREAWTRQVALLPRERLPEMARFVVREIPLRAGARDFLRLLGEYSVPTAILSGGLDFFIRPVLEREGIRYPVFSDAMETGPEGSLRVLHPHGHPTCRLCGICKAKITVEFDHGFRRTIFIGDGSTDKYAAEVADVIFARRRLKDYCERSGIPYFPFEDFLPVTARLEGWLTGREPMPPKRAAGVSGSSCPISHSLAESSRTAL